MIFEPSPMPNQMMNSGTSAIFGIGNSADTTAMPGERSADHSPTASPMPMPNTVPTVQPIASRNNDADRCCQSSPLTVRCHNSIAMFTGAGRNSVGITPAQQPSCHSATTPISVAAAAQKRSLGAKPPPRNGTGPSMRRMFDLPLGRRGIIADQPP